MICPGSMKSITKCHQGSHNIRLGLVGLPMMCFQMPSFLGAQVPGTGLR